LLRVASSKLNYTTAYSYVLVIL